jgi:hypothetical protein
VSSWERFGEWFATVAVASFAWVSGLAAPGVPVSSQAAILDTPGETQLSSVMRWAQQEDEPPVEQVGEDTDDDVETLDEAAPPADELDTADDVELLDQGPPAEAQEDVELLDQGPLPAAVSESPAPASVSTVPVTTYVVPAASSAPILPDGFGTGDIHVATGSDGFPVALNDCHVGAVTGRAYVGVDCGDGNGSSFVGHALSFDQFPFVVDENFPFDRESVFAEPAVDDGATQVIAARGARRDDNAAGPEIWTSGASSVELTQRTRERKPQVETENGRAKRGNKKRGSRNANSTVSGSQDTVDGTSTETTQEKKSKGKDRVRAGTTGKDKKKKAKSSKTPKKHVGKKGKKNRA